MGLGVGVRKLHAEEDGDGFAIVSSANGLSEHGGDVDDFEFFVLRDSRIGGWSW